MRDIMFTYLRVTLSGWRAADPRTGDVSAELQLSVSELRFLGINTYADIIKIICGRILLNILPKFS
jgi:hypothetical protein